jgi:transmembrane sensor
VVWSAAAGILVAVGIGTAAFVYLSTPVYETRVGEQRDVLLPDGSRVTLNTGTELTVHYSDKRRYIELERGEALFAVRLDATRPFEVAAGGTLTRALGTEFNVDMRDTRVTVSVLEGAVRVLAASMHSNTAPGAAAGGSANRESGTALAKGEAVEFRPAEHRVHEAPADLKRIDAWRTRRLEFSDTPLAEAVEEFNRYTTTHLTIATPELATVRVSGVFRIGDAEGFLFSLREALSVQAHESTNEVILMRPAR